MIDELRELRKEYRLQQEGTLPINADAYTNLGDNKTTSSAICQSPLPNINGQSKRAGASLDVNSTLE